MHKLSIKSHSAHVLKHIFMDQCTYVVTLGNKNSCRVDANSNFVKNGQ